VINLWVREHYGAGHKVFSEGDSGRHAYLIERGAIRISAHRQGTDKEVALLGEGDMFGEIALIDRRPRTATATALEETTLIPISRELIVNKLRQSDPLLSYILEVVVERWRESLGGEPTVALPQFSPEEGITNPKQFAIDQLKIAQGLSDAIEREKFVVYFQPVVHLHNRHLAGFEALIRWNQPERGSTSQTGFIGIAENTGLIVPIGRWVLKTALESLGGFQSCMDAHHPGNPGLFMSVNVSARQLQEPGEVAVLIDTIRDSGVDPRRVKLEVTESALIDNPEAAATALRQLKSLGLMLAIDDFGTGYSSLSYLSQYPLDTLKIDQSFVFNMLVKESSRRITRAIASMAHELGMKCIAEGVAQEADIGALLEMRVEYGQGYYFSKPRPHAQISRYIAEYGGGVSA
jgi:EAL domain-containing protein (putative c-di-GMP-specific phosphodiesterase class I)